MEIQRATRAERGACSEVIGNSCAVPGLVVEITAVCDAGEGLFATVFQRRARRRAP